jgi:hypothetical protein
MLLILVIQQVSSTSLATSSIPISVATTQSGTVVTYCQQTAPTPSAANPAIRSSLQQVQVNIQVMSLVVI